VTRVSPFEGTFIVLEGPDGVGKSTQVDLLARRLVRQGEVVVTREPGGVPFAETVREFLLAEPVSQVAQALLFAAARSLHVDQVVAPALARGATVISDRYWPSTYVYQGSTWGMGKVAELEQICEHPVPDEVVVLCREKPFGELSASDPFEHADLHAWGMRMELYREVALGHRWRCVDADGTPGEVHERIVAAISQGGIVVQ